MSGEEKARNVSLTLMRQALHTANLCMVRLRWNRYVRHLIMKYALPHRFEWAPKVDALFNYPQQPAYYPGVDVVVWISFFAPDLMYWEGTGTSHMVIANEKDFERIERQMRLTLLYIE